MNVEVKPTPASASMLVEPPLIARVGVIGAGQMGNGIAHVCALAGLQVSLLDAKADALDKAMATMGRNMDRQVNRSLISPEDKIEALARIKTGTDYAMFDDADLVIEAATEKEDIKRAIFKQLVPHLKPACLLASNTSSISITRLGAATDRPEKFIGMHFMNPVPVMKLVEIIRGIATDEPTFQAVQTLAMKLGKIPAVAEDFPGVHRQPHPGADDQRGGLRAVRRRGVGVRHRHVDAAGRQPSDGTAGTGGFHRAGYLPVDHAGAVRGAVGFQVPAVPAAGEIRRGGLAGPQDQPRLLRLHAESTPPDAVVRRRVMAGEGRPPTPCARPIAQFGVLVAAGIILHEIITTFGRVSEAVGRWRSRASEKLPRYADASSQREHSPEGLTPRQGTNPPTPAPPYSGDHLDPSSSAHHNRPARARRSAGPAQLFVDHRRECRPQAWRVRQYPLDIAALLHDRFVPARARLVAGDASSFNRCTRMTRIRLASSRAWDLPNDSISSATFSQSIGRLVPARLASRRARAWSSAHSARSVSYP